MRLFSYLPLAGVLCLAAIVFVWRPWLQRRRHGSWGVVLFKSDNRAQIARDTMMMVMFALLLGQAVVAARWPQAPEVRPFLGAALLLGGLLLLVAAQLNLGASWRIGIEESARPGLVTDGLYAYCRNPIFLALLVILAGYTLLVPTVLSALVLAGGYVAIRQQIAAEERYLLHAYGDAYRDYARRVGRIVPGIGKLV